MSTDPGLEALTTLEWAYGVLNGDADLQNQAGSAEALEARITDGTATPDAPWWITLNPLAPIDVKAVGMIQVMARCQVQVKVVGAATSYAPLIPVYRRVHALLEGRTNGTTALGQVLTFHRVSGVAYPEQANGIQYRHLGGLYEALTQ